MANQFIQKLLPFAQWIKAGNVEEQAKESGLQFVVDASQAGFNDNTVHGYSSTSHTFLAPAFGGATVTNFKIVSSTQRLLGLQMRRISGGTFAAATRVTLKMTTDTFDVATKQQNGTNSVIIFQLDGAAINLDGLYIPLNYLVLSNANLTLEIAWSNIASNIDAVINVFSLVGFAQLQIPS